MLIEAQDAFKSWLTAVLKPLCDADPAALAKYVIALIKKDKTEEELRKTMKEQLLIFLQDDTVLFVDQVFQMLETKDYITNPVIPSTNPPNPSSVKSTKDSVKEVKNGVSSGESPVNDGLKKDHEPKKEIDVKKDCDLKKEREYKKIDSEKEEKPRRRSRHRSLSPRNRTRSRSRSWDRIRRSRSREKSRERDQQHRLDREKRERARQWRNKSPPRRYERRRSRTPSPSRPRSRSRSPRHQHRNRYRNRTPPRSPSTSRSRSPPEKRERKDSGKDKEPKEVHSRPGTPTQDSNHGDLDLRLTNSTQSIQRAVALQTKRRCRDFDERGYCMRGDMCPFDHGVDPVVLEDTHLTSVLTYNPNGTPEVPPVIPPVVAPGHAMLGPRMVPPEYNPQAPQMWNRSGYRGPRPLGLQRLPQMTPFQQQNNMQRELIPVPVLDNKKTEPYGAPLNTQQHQNFTHNMDGLGFKKKNFDYNRLGPRTKNLVNCSLELKKVPPGLNTILHLHEHFSKFGTIVNIQVNYEGDSEAALVTFSSHAEANAAYRSTEAVLNNRFIKVFWHNNGEGHVLKGKQENIPPTRSVKDRLGTNNVVHPNSNKVLNLVQPRADNPLAETDGMNNNNNTESAAEKAAVLAKSTTMREEAKAQEVATIKKGQELLAAKDKLEKLKKNRDEAQKDAMISLRNRSQELLIKQIEYQKHLVDKMEKMAPGPQKDVLKETAKRVQEKIEELKSDCEKITLASAKAPTVPRKKTKEETQKEMLDIELDLIAKQQEGVDTTELQKKIRELKAKASLVTSSRGRGRGRRFTPVNRHLLTKNNLVEGAVKSTSLKLVNRPSTSFQKHAVDHRPTTLLVSGYETEEQEAVIRFFKQFGEIVDHHIDSTLPSVILNYKTRKEAETALVKGKHFQDRTLSVTWCNGMPPVKNTLTRSSSRTVLVSESEEQMIDDSLLGGDDELVADISEEVLLHDDEEEEEENEDRSWRR